MRMSCGPLLIGRAPSARLRAALALALAVAGPLGCEAWSRLPRPAASLHAARLPRRVACDVGRCDAQGRGDTPERFNGTWACNAEVEDGMTVRLFPGYAQQLDDSEWLLSLRGWVCDSQIRSPRRRLASIALQRGVWSAVEDAGEGDDDGAGVDLSHPARSDMQRLALLRRRVSLFLTKSHESIQVPLALTTAEGRQLWTTKTNSAGHFTVRATVPQQPLLNKEKARQLPGGTWITSVATTPTVNGRVFETAALGTFHLKDLHYKGRRLLNLFRSSTALKPKQIETLLKSFPQRTFVLVGDSGEKDPQIYAQIAKQHRSQIAHVYIRNVPTKKTGFTPVDETRASLARHFRGLPDEMWTVFDRASTITDDAAKWPRSSK
ncbi:hypothetical protein T492DRAFT_955901 [Pavlovales sp. CCMP2436]|nr:hypothetical protein T492DRAFT_955901 [Pavlovales sp. CCMP2436]